MKFGLTQYTLDHFFDRVIEQYAARPSLALVGDEPFTYGEFGRRIDTLKSTLRAVGIKKRDKVAILGHSSPNWAIAYMAVLTTGAVAVPILEEFPAVDIDHKTIEAKLLESIFVEETLVYELDDQLVARIHPNYAYIQSMDEKKDESSIASDIQKILENVRREVNSRLPGFSKIARVIEQDSPFIKTPTNKIKRAEYVPGYIAVK